VCLIVPSVQCSECIKKAPNAQYDFKQSSTSKPISCTFGQCSFSNSYETCDLSDPSAVCTITGLWYNDAASIGDLGPVTLSFGSILTQTDNFDQFLNIDGVMGIAGSNDETNMFSQLVTGGLVAENVFAMCLHHGSTSNGSITLGGVDSRLYHGDFQWVDNAYGIGSGFGLNIAGGIMVGDSTSPVEGTSSVATLDSGTNVLLLLQDSFDAMQQEFESNCTNNPLKGICNVASGQSLFDGVCYALTAAEVAMFPDLTVALENNVMLVMSGQDYLLKNEEAGLLCLGIRPSNIYIVGDTTMQKHYVAFNRDKNTIGWAEVNSVNCGSL